jgi:1-acyl-sn-glycerol-3-phosphate acyltransferase
MLLRLLATVKIEGLENVPPQGGFIMTPNHLSQIDPPLMLAALPRRIRVLAAQKYRRNPILLFLFEGMGCIWVRQFEADHEALRACLRFLRSGGVLGVSPEGTRSRITHALIRGRGGAAFLASRSGVKILPAAVWGTDTFFHDVLHFRRPKVYVRHRRSAPPFLSGGIQPASEVGGVAEEGGRMNSSSAERLRSGARSERKRG